MTEVKGEQSKTSRIEWIDAVKGIVIILVVLGHKIQFGSGAAVIEDALYFSDRLFQMIYTFHMPCLMMISGYFFAFTIGKPNFWKKRISAVLIPTLAWSLIPAGLSLAKQVVTRNVTVATLTNMLRIMISSFWFLWAILFCTLLVWMIHRFCKDNIFVHIAIGVILLFVEDWLNTELWKYMYPYFVAGYYWNAKQKSGRKLVEHKGIITVILVVAFLFLFQYYNIDTFIYTTGITVRSLEQLAIDVYRYAIGFVGAAMVIWVVYLLYPWVDRKMRGVNRIIVYCGRASLSIYMVDCLINSYVLPRITSGFSLHYAVVIVETFIVMIVCLAVDRLVKSNDFTRKLLLGGR